MKITHPKYQKNQFQKYLVTTASCLLIVLSTSVNLVKAQSTDRDKPTPLTSNEVTGPINKDSLNEHFYTFMAGAGEVVVTVDAFCQEGGVVEAYVDLFDTNAQEIASLSPSGSCVIGSPQSERKVKRLQFRRQIPVIMRIKPQIVSVSRQEIGSYKVQVRGAVNLSGAQSSPAGSSASVLTVPKKGTLRIEMNDGTVQQVDLGRVRRVQVQE
ncbi:hypothetical protein DP113_24965 [Brasilonema octagenarum UFV-E1]|uniref:Uncharacterized protein n=2 Tax=Brasilonema TaxID=383614 RepID=A0A856MP57_9CYAN|nr:MULTISPECIES: hypothetical protein [Brasilonema]NMF63037.1 hypothetical protein [Brasilonema octagenarum UFV-OR1]QDL10736.1 hypothetical protein DP114_25065 [Brasilonema sennae CENA114]QDL17080.1 hypothetical protein DP113_24965 [Brasilonema octagenarum UFV-E1]